MDFNFIVKLLSYCFITYFILIQIFKITFLAHLRKFFTAALVFVVVRIELRVHVRIDVRIVNIGMHFLLVNLIIDFGDTIVIFCLTGFTNITCSCTRSFESVCVDFDTPFAFDINTFLRESQVTNVCVPFVTRVYFCSSAFVWVLLFFPTYFVGMV